MLVVVVAVVIGVGIVLVECTVSEDDASDVSDERDAPEVDTLSFTRKPLTSKYSADALFRVALRSACSFAMIVLRSEGAVPDLRRVRPF